MPHLHLSLQSGDEHHFETDEAASLRRDAIRFRDGGAPAATRYGVRRRIIPGFQTQTEKMLPRSLDLIKACGLTFLHVFPFRRAKVTPAARCRRSQTVRSGGVRNALGGRSEAAFIRRSLTAPIGATRAGADRESDRVSGRTERILPVSDSRAGRPARCGGFRSPGMTARV